MTVPHNLTEDDLADYLIENDPAFKTRIEEASIEYSTYGGIMADAMIKRLKRRLPHPSIDSEVGTSGSTIESFLKKL